jgi:hydrogenase expression/formation protein HypE|tara:strand:- start:701 stop:889 length:189 start_codon:yes stop_codon:yes gene_type:complete
MVVGHEDAQSILDKMKENPLGKEASIIGEISEDHKGMAWLNTAVGGKRVIEMLSGQQLPRIC